MREICAKLAGMDRGSNDWIDLSGYNALEKAMAVDLEKYFKVVPHDGHEAGNKAIFAFKVRIIESSQLEAVI